MYEIQYGTDTRTVGQVQATFLHDGEAIGGLWITDGELTDYDGVFSLPREVCEMLRSDGIKVSADFWP